MVSPLQEPRQAARRIDRSDADRTDAHVDLRRLEASIDWLRHEGLAARRRVEQPKPRAKRLPRAAQLPEVAGLHPADTEPGSALHPVPETPRSAPDVLDFELRPPLLGERWQPPAPAPQADLNAVFGILVGVVVASMIAYHI